MDRPRGAARPVCCWLVTTACRSLGLFVRTPTLEESLPMRRAKIVCTLGPASREPAFIGHLIDEGMNLARINFSHCEASEHAATVAAVQREAEKRGRPVAVLQDLQGP